MSKKSARDLEPDDKMDVMYLTKAVDRRPRKKYIGYWAGFNYTVKRTELYWHEGTPTDTPTSDVGQSSVLDLLLLLTDMKDV